MQQIFCALFLLPAFILSAQDQNTVNLIEYQPAPGQFINLPGSGTPEAAARVAEQTGGLVSLGAFGGYVIFRFSKPVENDPMNPYGVDFSISGNPLTDGTGKVRWSEPGIVSVMKDQNGNGLPDDIWYELAGSEHFFSRTSRGVSITYTDPVSAVATDVPWSCEDGSTGMIRANSFSTQPYFPMAAIFGNYAGNLLVLEGTRLRPPLYMNDGGEMVCRNRVFGYADNNRAGDMSSTLPDNPYTADTEGYGGDAFDISWAIDRDGNYMDLDRIDFIRVSTAVLEDGRWLGELSTEIRYIRDEAAQPAVSEADPLVVVGDYPGLLTVGISLQPEACFFLDGRKVDDAVFTWSTDNPALAGFSEGKLVLRKSGWIRLTASAVNYPGCSGFTEFEISEPAQLILDPAYPTLFTGEKIAVRAIVRDSKGRELSAGDISWSCSDTNLVRLNYTGGEAILEGLGPGTVNLEARLEGGSLYAQTGVTVYAAPRTVNVSFSCIDRQKTCLPRQEKAVSNFNLNPFTEGALSDFSPESISGVTLAHVVAAGFANEPFRSDLRFRESNGHLYLWKYPLSESDYTEYLYGLEPVAARAEAGECWLVLMNGVVAGNGLESVSVHDGDEILLFRISDGSEPWEIQQLHTDQYYYTSGEECKVELHSLSGSIGEGGVISTGSLTPVKNKLITIEKEGEKGSFPAGMTDQEGAAFIQVEGAGEMILSGGIPEARIVVGTTGTALSSFSGEIEAGPNPFGSELNFVASGGIYDPVLLMDIQGRVLKVVEGSGKNHIRIDVSSLPEGVYFYRIGNGVNGHSGKLMKLSDER